MEQKVNTNTSDIEALQTRADTFEEEIANNGTHITTNTTSINNLTPRVKACEDGVSRSDLSIETLQELVNSNDTAYKTRFSGVEEVASKAFNQSQTNLASINGLRNTLSRINEIDVATLTATYTSSVYTVSDMTAIYLSSTQTIYIPSISFYGNGTTISPSGTQMCTINVGFIQGFSDKSIISEAHQVSIGSNTISMTFSKDTNSSTLKVTLSAAGSFNMPSTAPITFNGCKITLI